MQRVITLFVSAYWTAYFGLLALAASAWAIGEGGHGETLVGTFGRLLGAGASPSFAALLAFGCAISAALFAWTLLDCIARPGTRRGDGDDVPRLALGISMGMTTLVLVAGVTQASAGPIEGSFIQFIALLASYVAIHVEQTALSRRAGAESGEPASLARMMALGAAHTSLLPRLSGRPERDTGKGS